jgi:hypothetical protein
LAVRQARASLDAGRAALAESFGDRAAPPERHAHYEAALVSLESARAALESLGASRQPEAHDATPEHVADAIARLRGKMAR